MVGFTVITPEAVHGPIRNLVLEAMSGINGLTLKEVNWHGGRNEGRRTLTFQIDFDCWATSMHTHEKSVVISLARLAVVPDLIADGMSDEEARDAAWRLSEGDARLAKGEARVEEDAEIARTLIMRELARELHVQRRLAAGAERLGIPNPMGRGGTGHGIRIDHMAASTVMLDALVARYGPARAWEILQDDLMRILTYNPLLSEPEFMEATDPTCGRTMTVMLTGDGVPVLDVPAGRIAGAAGLAMYYEEHGVRIGTPLPEAVLIASKGCRLGDVMWTGITDLDESTVLDAYATGGGTHFMLDLPLTMIADHPGLSVRTRRA